MVSGTPLPLVASAAAWFSKHTTPLEVLLGKLTSKIAHKNSTRQESFNLMDLDIRPTSTGSFGQGRAVSLDPYVLHFYLYQERDNVSSRERCVINGQTTRQPALPGPRVLLLGPQMLWVRRRNVKVQKNRRIRGERQSRRC